MELNLKQFQTVLGPIGLPSEEAVYPPIMGEGGAALSAQNDYVIRMEPEDMPPATAFWSTGSGSGAPWPTQAAIMSSLKV